MLNSSCKKKSDSFDEKVNFDKIDSVYLKSFNSENSNFSILIFGGGYFNSKLKVQNCEELEPEDSIQTLKLGPFAKIFRINKTCKTNFTDYKRNHYVEFNNDTIKKYKFIYVDREFESDSLIITFRNNHIPVK